MQFKIIPFLLCLFITFVTAAAIVAGKEEKAGWVVSFKDGTPDSVVAQTLESLEKVGAEVTHKFSLIKGFVMKATQSAVNEFLGLDAYTSLKAEWKPAIEADGVVTAFGGSNVEA